MKLQNKLIIAFMIILFIPAGLACLCFAIMSGYQTRLLTEAYGVESVSADIFDSNSIDLFNALSEKSFDLVTEKLSEDKEQFLNLGFVNDLNEQVGRWYSFLVVRHEDSFTYFGSGESDSMELFSKFPGYGTETNARDIVLYTGDKSNSLLKFSDFTFADDSKGTVFVVTPIGILPQIKSLYMEMGISILVILLFTMILMTVWIYSSIINPINKLQKATQAIKDGNLDYEVKADGDDEVSRLCRDFDDMRKRLKENQAEKIRSDEENKELISNISHDLKTPITSIKGYVEGILDGVASSPEKLDRYIRTIYNKANDMDRLIDELTFYSKIDTNKIPYNFAPINVVGYFDDCAEELGIELEEQGIRLEYRNFCDTDVMVIADAEQIKRVVNNIISNSVKYMDKPQGHINIRVKDLGDFVQVEIEDNGKGIAGKDIPNIFDRFYRTDKARNSRKGGSGIGLSIVHKIIEDHNGQIWATSKEGIGTVMNFVLRKYQEVRDE